MSNESYQDDCHARLYAELDKLDDLFKALAEAGQQVRMDGSASLIFGQVAATLNAWAACNAEADADLDQIVEPIEVDFVNRPWPELLGLDCSDIPEG